MMLTMLLSFFSTGDDGFDPILDHVGAPPKPPLTPWWNTLWTGGAALWGCVLYAYALHTSDGAHSLPIFQQHGAGPCLPACDGCPEGCQQYHCHTLSLHIKGKLMSIVHVHIRLIVHCIGSQIYEPKAIPQFIQYIQAVCGKLQGHYGSAHQSTLLPGVSQHLLFHHSQEGQAPFQHQGWPSWAAHLHVHLLHPASACRHVHRPQAVTPWELPSDSLESAV